MDSYSHWMLVVYECCFMNNGFAISTNHSVSNSNQTCMSPYANAKRLCLCCVIKGGCIAGLQARKLASCILLQNVTYAHMKLHSEWPVVIRRPTALPLILHFKSKICCLLLALINQNFFLIQKKARLECICACAHSDRSTTTLINQTYIVTSN